MKVAMGFRLVPSDLTLDDREGSKIKVVLFDVKYVKNGKNYDVEPMGFTLDDLERLKVKVTNGPVTCGDIRQSDNWRTCLSVFWFCSFFFFSLKLYFELLRPTVERIPFSRPAVT